MCTNNCNDGPQERSLLHVHDIVSALDEDSKPYQKHQNKTHNISPGWNEYVAEYCGEACEAWAIAGRPYA